MASIPEQPIPLNPEVPTETVTGQDLETAGSGEFGVEEFAYEQMLDDYSNFSPPSEGEVLMATVLKLTEKDAIVDFGYKSEGIVPLDQFAVVDGKPAVNVGDTIEVMVDKHAASPEG